MIRYFQASLGRLILAWGIALTATGYGIDAIFNSTTTTDIHLQGVGSPMALVGIVLIFSGASKLPKHTPVVSFGRVSLYILAPLLLLIGLDFVMFAIFSRV